ncbi:hypothetical protein BaRGS_00036139 [Batillaria attramentaria]|uniref:Uncharacterized protein n=1 Tax=Batillaria attramentaria TaxID=370345 RepID=A0ABD0JCJ4_9CAEN
MCGADLNRARVGLFMGVLLKILSRKARIAAQRIRGLRVGGLAAKMAVSTLLALLVIGCVELNPGPDSCDRGDKNTSNRVVNAGANTVMYCASR